MRSIIFTEEFCQPEHLFPLSLTRQIQDCRVGILTIREKWERSLGLPSFDKKEDNYKDHEKSVQLAQIKSRDNWYLIHSNLLPTQSLVTAILKMKEGECLVTPTNAPLAYYITSRQLDKKKAIKIIRTITYADKIYQVQNPWDLLAFNDWSIREDFKLLTKGRKSAVIPKGNNVSGLKNIFIEKGASVQFASINATEGPIYIAKGATILEGACLRGPIGICEGATVKMGAKIYGATTIGPSCVVGGEIKNSILFGYSNKAHDGYLGDSVIGEWCNLGAGTSNSNIKNNAGPVRVYTLTGELEIGLKCGVVMGDYVRTSINSSINTGSVIGTSSVIFGAALTPRYIPPFSWGEEGITRYKLDKVVRDIEQWKVLKGMQLTANEIKMLKFLYKNH
jgi:UDP-N-acetylglucosamine diphosphorylase/glucosamine-1-phosphate N-acetyltransferase